MQAALTGGDEQLFKSHYLTCLLTLSLKSFGTTFCAFLCRLLQHSVAEARRVIATQPPPILQFAEEQSPELRDRIFDEFNSLAVVYQAPSSTFLQEKPQEEVGVVLVLGLPEADASCVASEIPQAPLEVKFGLGCHG